MLAGARPAPADPNVHAHNGFVSLVAFYGAALAEANARWELAGREIARLEACCHVAEDRCRELEQSLAARTPPEPGFRKR